MKLEEDSWELLFVRYFDGTLDDEGMEELNGLLVSSPKARARFNDAVLIGQTLKGADAEVKPRIARFPLLWSGAGLAVLILILAASIFQKDDSTSIGTMETTSGTVEVIGEVHSGEVITSTGAGGSTLLKFLDGTRIALAGDTTLTVTEDDARGKHVRVHTGSVIASVEKQPPGKPMVLVTSQARIEVLGTEFSLDTSTDATGLGVSEGRVRVVRLSDGESVEVVENNYVVAGRNRTFLPQPRPGVPDKLAIDFRSGLPPGWLYGLHRPRTADLPGRVGTEKRPGQPQGVHHPNLYSEPLGGRVVRIV